MQAGATPPLPLFDMVAARRTVSVDTAHIVRAASVRCSPRGTRPNPAAVLGDHIAVFAILVTGQQENHFLHRAVQLIAVIGHQIDNVRQQIIHADLVHQPANFLADSGLAPVVAALEILLTERHILSPEVSGDGENAALLVRVEDYPLQPLKVEVVARVKILNAFVIHGKTSKCYYFSMSLSSSSWSSLE